MFFKQDILFWKAEVKCKTFNYFSLLIVKALIQVLQSFIWHFNGNIQVGYLSHPFSTGDSGPPETLFLLRNK